MKPLKFEPLLKSTIWGGNKIIAFKHLDIKQDEIGLRLTLRQDDRFVTAIGGNHYILATQDICQGVQVLVHIVDDENSRPFPP